MSKLKRQADDLEEELQTAYDNIALAPERQAAQIAKIDSEYAEQINEQKVRIFLKKNEKTKPHTISAGKDANRTAGTGSLPPNILAL